MPTNRIGIIDKEKNPFVRESWIRQGFPLTDHRQNQVESLLEESVENIRKVERDRGSSYGTYPAFVAIRWGFAQLKEGRLVATSKWIERGNYNGYGERNR